MATSYINGVDTMTIGPTDFAAEAQAALARRNATRAEQGLPQVTAEMAGSQPGQEAYALGNINWNGGGVGQTQGVSAESPFANATAADYAGPQTQAALSSFSIGGSRAPGLLGSADPGRQIRPGALGSAGSGRQKMPILTAGPQVDINSVPQQWMYQSGGSLLGSAANSPFAPTAEQQAYISKGISDYSTAAKAKVEAGAVGYQRFNTPNVQALIKKFSASGDNKGKAALFRALQDQGASANQIAKIANLALNTQNLDGVNLQAVADTYFDPSYNPEGGFDLGIERPETAPSGVPGASPASPNSGIERAQSTSIDSPTIATTTATPGTLNAPGRITPQGVGATTINSTQIGPTSITAGTASTPTIDAAQSVVDPTETVSGQLDRLLAADSPYLQRAQALAQQRANGRGLINSSIAAGAGATAAIDAALGIATPDASIYNQSRLANTAAENQTRQFNATNAFDASKFNVGNDLSAQQFNAATAYDASKTNAASDLAAQEFNASTAYDASKTNAANDLNSQQFNTANEFEAARTNNANAFDASKFNAANELDTSRFNASNRLGVDQFNASNENDTSRFNAGQGNAFNLAQQDLGIRRDQLSQQDRQFNANLDQDDRQFGANLNQNSSQFDRDITLRNQQLNQQDRQFGANLNQQDRQFDANLNQDDRQFNANLNQQGSQFNANLNQNASQFDREIAFRNSQLAQSGSQFDRQLLQQDSQFARDLASKYDLTKIGEDSKRSLLDVEQKYRLQLQNDNEFNNQYRTFVDALFRIDSDTNLDAGAKTQRKADQLKLLNVYAGIRGLNLDFSGLAGLTAPPPTPAPAQSDAPAGRSPNGVVLDGSGGG